MNTRKELSFDGFGINGPDEFRERIATFTRHSHAYTQTQLNHYGKLFENSPEMLAALRDCCDAWTQSPEAMATAIDRALIILQEFPQ